jgi:hypothetical protein
MFVAHFDSLIITVILKTNDVCIPAMLFYVVQKNCFKRSSYSFNIYYDAVFKDPTLSDVTVTPASQIHSSDVLFLTAGN